MMNTPKKQPAKQSPLGGALVALALVAGSWSHGYYVGSYSTTAPAPAPIPAPPLPPGPAPTPAPIPAPGFRVLIVYDTAALQKLPIAQSVIINSETIRQYLDSHCVTMPGSSAKGYCIWDHNVLTTGMPQVWQYAMARPHPTLPWILISNGTTGFEGPLPGTVADTLTLLQKYGGS